MFRSIAVLALVMSFLSGAVAAQDEERPLARAMDLMRDGNWAAAQIEARADGQAALDVILWHYLRAGQGDARQVQDFLARNPDWPGLPYLREKSEAAMTAAPHEAVRAFFADTPPETGAGALSLARAHLASGDAGAANAGLVLAWRTLRLTSEEQRAFLDAHSDLLKPHHEARLDMALWKGWTTDAKAMMPLVNEDHRALAEARIGLRNNEGNVDALIAAVPAALADAPGLAYERFYWRLRKGRMEDAVTLLLERSASVDDLGEPWAWARHRADLAREEMRDGNHARAYRIAAEHGLTEGSDYAELEWLAGYLSLRFLDAPERALAHFKHLRRAVDTPISLGRAGYWIGRAHESLGDTQAAKEAYGFGARYQTSFYGLLAAEKLGAAPAADLAGKESFRDWQAAEFVKSSVFDAAVMLLASGELSLAERFFTHLAESLDRTQIGQMGAFLEELGQSHIQVMLGKRAARYGMELPGPYYALHPVASQDHPVPTELVLAIARRESEFDPNVVSPVGARGLMQVMPRTAKEVAGWLDISYEEDRLLDDPEYNARLGAAYLAHLARKFEGNAVMIAAGYNAGPSRPERWMRERGDPRAGAADIVDWIEHIPFDETRNYVMRVTESLPVYRARLGKPPHPVPFSEELAGSTLLPRTP